MKTPCDMKEINNKELLELCSRIQELYFEGVNRLHYGANLIDELHANENAHSRILRMLIAYRGDGTYPVFKSFLKLMTMHCGYAKDLKVCSPLFSNEEARIDVLIKDYKSEKPYAIIIENKVCDAVDQDAQIQRYVDAVMNDCPCERIFVIYLTKDKEKVVTERSFTQKAQAILGYTKESNGRYIPINYKDDILPWLEQDVLPNLPIKESLLAASVKLYIDYLKGMFMMRENEKPVLNKLYAFMRNELNIQSITDSLSFYEKVGFLKSSIEAILFEDIDNVLNTYLYNPLEVRFPGLKIYGQNRDTEHFLFYVTVPQWGKAQISLNWDRRGQYIGIGNLSLDNPLDEMTRNILHERLGGEGSTDWWPWYKYVNTLIPNIGTTNIWKEVESGTVLTFFTQWISHVLECTKDLDM